MPTDITNKPDELFELFVNAQTFKTILHSFEDLCRILRIDRHIIGYGKRSLYKILISKLTSWKSKSLWAKIDKRGSQKEYENGHACADTKVCIVGAGPVGLRLAIECALLGARCIVVEKRDRFSRHNVLHLWPYVITDLKNLGAKVFYGKFATGQIEHISIRQLQCILLKIALILGVEIYQNVTFINVIEPTSPLQGWRAHFEPEIHPVVSNYEFNVLIGADGRRNSLQGFQHKEFRGKLAIGITCNYVNHHSREEQNFEEISGVAKIYNPQFFNELQQQTSIDLENIVYYKNDTHYFVMTAKKQSLLDKHVILQDYPDAARLLARDNVNFNQLCNFAVEAAQFATKCSTKFKFQFAENHYGTADVQMFDFTSLFHAVNASRIVERNGKQIFMALVGDSLLESFWPTGSGAGLGFLGLFDTAWSILKFSKHDQPLKILVERESIYMLLSQSTPENTKNNHQLYSINPATRYRNLNLKRCTIDEIRYLYDSDSIPTIDMNNNNVTINKTNRTNIRRAQSFQQTPSPLPSSNGNNEQEILLIDWCEEIADSYSIEVKNDSKAFQNGLAFCAIVNYYRPDLIDFKSLQSDRPISNFQMLFDIMHNQLSLPVDRKLQNSLILSMKSSIEERIRQSSIVILQLLYTHFHHDHHEQQLQQRRSSTPSLELSSPTLQICKKSTDEINNNPLDTNTNPPNNNNSTVKVSALVAHYSSGETSSSSSTTNNQNLIGLQSERAPTFCFYCKEKVSIQDWFVVEKNVLHVKCFKCDTCHLQLRKTNYQIYIEPQTGKTSFHCRYHNLNKQQKEDENTNQLKLNLDQCKRPLSFNETDINKKRQISSDRHLDNTTADERVSFTLEKEILDNDKDEIVYSSTSNIINDDDDEQISARTNDNLTNSSLEETTDDDEEDEEEEENDESENDEQENNEDDDSVLKLDTSKSDSVTEISKTINDKKSLAERKQYFSIDSGHIQSESPSSDDLSPSSPSPLNQHITTTTTKSEPTTYAYFRAPCPVCSGSTYDETTIIEIGKQYYHKTCLVCYSCEKQLKESEFNFHDLSSDGIRHFYCTLHYCKSRLKQVTSTLATATQQESRSTTTYPNLTHLRTNTNPQWNNNLRLYPSLKDALSHKPHPLNLVNIPENEKKREAIGFEHLNQSILNNKTPSSSSSSIIRSRTFDECLSTRLIDNNENIDSKQTTNDLSKQRFKRRGRNRPSSPLPLANYETILTTDFKQNQSNIETNSTSTINRKKKRILIPQSNLNRSSSSTTSSQSLDDDKQRSSDERRRQREERQKELVRFRRSQEIQRELDELEQKRLELDKRHMIARQNLNLSTYDDKKRSFWERECLCIVRERTSLQRTEDELLMAKLGLTLENERARAENEYRQLIYLPDENKTAKDKEREEQLLTTISNLVEKRNKLTTELDQMRLREIQEDECLRHAYRLHGIEHQTTSFHALDILKDII